MIVYIKHTLRLKKQYALSSFINIYVYIKNIKDN